MKIKFSHKYNKLKGVDGEAMLLEVLEVNIEDLSPALKYYDTTYCENNEVKQYHFPKKGKYLLLIFQSMTDANIFTTIRRSTPQKLAYYKENVGRRFDVEINVAQT
jgi:hypothetical protein